MRLQSILPLTIFLGLLALRSAARTDDTAAPATPASLVVPAGQRLALTLTARGVQIYTCQAVPDHPDKFAWSL